MKKEIKNYEDYSDALHTLWGKYAKEPVLNDTLHLGVGIACSYKSNVDLLWMGINPSCPDSDNKPLSQPFPSFEETLSNPDKTYWKTVKKILEGISIKFTKEHLDLFAIRKTPQDFLRSIGTDREDNPALHFLADHLWFTQQFLENYLKPKVIVLANKAAGAYLGLNPKYTWMGYNTEIVGKLPCGSVYKIIGIRNNERIIRQNNYNGELIGTVILHARFQGNGCPTEQQIKPEHIETLLKYF